MRNLPLLLLAISAMSLSTDAAIPAPALSEINARLLPAVIGDMTLKPAEIPVTGNSELNKAIEARNKFFHHADGQETMSPTFVETGKTRFPLPRKQRARSKERLDSIITVVNSTGEPYMATMYEYDSQNMPKLQNNCYWNPMTGEWDIVEQYGYGWNEDGYCMYQWQINSMYANGLKYEYAYDDNNLGISRIEYTYADGEWVPSTQNAYGYDSNGFVVEEFLRYYDLATGTWQDYMWNKVVCDDLGRNIRWEGYLWNGSDWKPYAEQQEIEYGEDGNVNLVTFRKWMYDSEWVNYYQINNVYDNGVIMSQEHRFWNRALSSWVGRDDFDTGYPCTNLMSIFEYDSKGRMTAERVSQGLTTDGYTKSLDSETVYTPTEDGGYDAHQNQYWYADDQITRESRKKVIRHYNAADNLTYSFTTMLENGDWINKSEEISTFTEDNLVSTYRSYTFSNTPDNKKYAGISIDYFYDSDNNLKDKYYMIGLGTGEDDWYNTTHYEYNYERGDYQVDELCSKWDGSKYVPRNGDGWRYDFETTPADLILWVGALPEYKILERRVYVNNNGEWDYYLYNHHYSLQEEVGIDANHTGRNETIISVSDDGNMVTVDSDGETLTTIFSVSGAIMASSRQSHIDISSYPAGLYVANANGQSLKFVKR